MKIAIAAELDQGEPRVAATPETVKKMIGLGAEVAVEPGAGVKSGILDADYAAAGATVAKDAAQGADVVLRVRRPGVAELKNYRKGALVIAIMDPYGNDAALRAMAEAGITAFAMELMPRITRAQSMDVLSSQANLAGYRAVIDASAEYGRAFPMMMTAAGTVPAARVFIMGVGVAGLQAIATARRLGAVVTATDVRPATKEQVESLGAKFLAVEDEEFKNAADRRRLRQGNVEGVSGQASRAGRRAHQEAGRRHHHRADSGPAGAAADLRRHGRLDEARLGDRRSRGRARRQCRGRQGRRRSRTSAASRSSASPTCAGRLAASASALYAKNLLTFLDILVDKKDKKLAVNWDDEIVKATALTRDGAVVHPNFLPKSAA